MLHRRGFAVDLVSDGLEAVEQLDPEHHAAVFMDCQMPHLDGYEATARIRAAGHRIPIIAMTAHAFAGDRERCLQAGMDDYLSKPLRSEDLDPVLERWLSVRSDLLDDERLSRLAGAGPTLVDRLVEAFARTTPPLLEELRLAVSRGDDTARRALAHKLRGSAETVGAQRLAALARKLELDEEIDIAELPEAYRETLAALEQLTRDVPA